MKNEIKSRKVDKLKESVATGGCTDGGKRGMDGRWVSSGKVAYQRQALPQAEFTWQEIIFGHSTVPPP